MSTLQPSHDMRYTQYDTSKLKFIDIGANLSDHMYKGYYNHSNKAAHPNDLENVLKRAFANHVDKLILTGTTLSESKEVLDIALSNDNLFITCGVHPTRCNEFDRENKPDEYFEALLKFIRNNDKKTVAIGEMGLDYDRLHFCPKNIQQKYFEKQLELVELIKKPLFLHCRNAYADFYEIVKRHHDKIFSFGGGGVVHSFTGTADEAKLFTDLGYYIGINGCSLKTQENIDAMCSIPSKYLMIETDCPWCEVKASHAGSKFIKTRMPAIKKENWKNDILVKGRNEPAAIIQVLEIMAATRNEDLYELANTMYENSKKLFKI